MNSRLKVFLAILVLTAALPVSTFALSIIPPDHSCTVSIGGRTFGFMGYSAKTLGSGVPVTYFDYGWGSWEVHLPFHSVFGGAALIAVFGLFGVFILRRRHAA